METLLEPTPLVISVLEGRVTDDLHDLPFLVDLDDSNLSLTFLLSFRLSRASPISLGLLGLTLLLWA